MQNLNAKLVLKYTIMQMSNIIESVKICLYIVKDIYVYLNMAVRRFKTSHFLQNTQVCDEDGRFFFQNVTHDAHQDDAVNLGMHIFAISVNSLRIILFILQGLILFYSMPFFNYAENDGGLCRFAAFYEMCSKI